MSKSNRSCFTLIEMVLACGIFLLLMSICLVLFSAIQGSWNNLRGRNESSYNIRLVMDILTSSLESSVSGYGRNSFELHNAISGDSSVNLLVSDAQIKSDLAFFTLTSRKLASKEAADGMHAVKICLEEGVDPVKGELVMYSIPAGAADTADTFRNLNTQAADFSAARREVLAENVSDFIVQADPAGNGLVKRPREITLTVAVFDSPENYQVWRKAPDAAFRQAHEQRYVRKVVFDDVEILHNEVLK